ncbi:MAG: hypothetical protein P0S94_04745, partial [Simkaniaceae bacterium]|nr:hypothetical protein [Simkaniaceae bacterium]
MGDLSTGGAQPTQNQTQQIRDATGASDVENAAAHVTARVNNRQQARLTRQWQSDLVQHANQVNNTLDPSTPAGRANVLSTNIMIATLNVANSYALVPMQNEINDLANLQNVVTNVQSSLNTMSNFLSNVVGSPLSGQQYENQFNSFVSSYDNLFLAGQPGNSANKLGDMNLYVRVMEPAHMVKGKMVQPQVVTVAVPADSPIMQTYWNKFEKSMPPLVGPNGQDYFGGNSKNQMFIGGTANANTAVSGVQYYA